MVCCLLCFSDKPVDDDPKGQRPNEFQITMMDGLCKNQPVCCGTCVCAPCSAIWTRYRVLDGKMENYMCCQNYIQFCCFKGGACGEQHCPHCCLCLEAFCCVGPSMSSSRAFVMDMYDLRSDPCDNRLIRFSNCLQILSCICDILAIFCDEFRTLADLVRLIATIVFYCTLGCMAAQVNYEVDYRRANGGAGVQQTAVMAHADVYK